MILPGVTYVPSPNFSERKGYDVEGIVLHYSGGGSAHGLLRWMCNPMSRVSAHILISRDGSVWQLVPLSKKAWHAGISEWDYQGETMSDCNYYTVGIECANTGYVVRGADGLYYYEVARRMYPYRQSAQPVKAKLTFDRGHSIAGYWEPYPDPQMSSLVRVIHEIRKAFDKPLPLVGHDEIGMPLGRKIDPGPLFPWTDFGRSDDQRRTKSELLELVA